MGFYICYILPWVNYQSSYFSSSQYCPLLFEFNIIACHDTKNKYQFENATSILVLSIQFWPELQTSTRNIHHGHWCLQKHMHEKKYTRKYKQEFSWKHLHGCSRKHFHGCLYWETGVHRSMCLNISTESMGLHGVM